MHVTFTWEPFYFIDETTSKTDAAGPLILSPGQPVVPPVQPGVTVLLNWSHFKPELANKPDEDVKAHLLRTNDGMDIHAFPRRCQHPEVLSNFGS